MRTSVTLTLAAGLSICGIDAAAAGSDVAIWRWHVTNALRAQQRQADPPRLQEGRASAIDTDGAFEQRYERYVAGGLLAPAGDAGRR